MTREVNTSVMFEKVLLYLNAVRIGQWKISSLAF